MFNFISVSNSSIGEVILDAVTSEEHESELTITENPIESGAQIADHAFLNPKVVTITGVMVDHNHQSLSNALGAMPGLRGIADFLNAIPLPASVSTYTSLALNKANEVAGRINGILEQAKEGARVLAPWLPDFNIGELLGAGGGSRVQKCYADLVKSQKAGEPIEINTGVSMYKNMLIQKVSVSQDKLGSATFTITAREIFIVDTAYTKSESKSKAGGGKSSKNSSPAGASKSGRAATQSAQKAQAGTTQATPVKTSTIYDLVG